MEAEEQHIRIRAILEVIGKPKKFVEDALKEYIDKIKEDDNLMIVSENMSEPQERDNVFSLFTEIEVVIKGLQNLVGFCIDYMPSSIEVIKPEEFHFQERIFTDFVNDMLAKLHRVDMIAKQANGENTVLKQNLANMIKNNIMIMLQFNINKMDGLVKGSGIGEKELKKFIDILVKEGKIEEKEGDYFLKNG